MGKEREKFENDDETDPGSSKPNAVALISVADSAVKCTCQCLLFDHVGVVGNFTDDGNVGVWPEVLVSIFNTTILPAAAFESVKVTAPVIALFRTDLLKSIAVVIVSTCFG